MRFKSSLLLLSMVATNCAVSQAAPVRKIVPQGTTSFVAKEQRFSIWLPTQPKVTLPKDQKGVTDSVILRSDIDVPKEVNAINRTISFFVIATPRLRLKKFPTPQAELLSMQESYRTSIDGIGRSEEIRMGRFAGLNLTTYDVSGSYVDRKRFYSTPEFLYEISIGGYAEAMKSQAAQVNRVLDSFRILP